MRLQTHGGQLPAPHGRRHPAVLVILAVVATLAGSLMITADAAAAPGIQLGNGLGSDFFPQFDGNLFGPFFDRTGLVQNATNNPGVVNARNAFFDTHLGTNGQACVTCHQPGQGFSVTVPFIQQRFALTFGEDPLFRANSTADRPDADLSTVAKRRQAFELFLKLGVVRIGKTLPAGAQFSFVPQTSQRFGALPNLADPQAAPGTPTLSLFRRPLATTNMRFDTAVLWDGRQNIHNLRTQVKAAARTLMLGSNVSDAQADSIATFMTDVFTAQELDFTVGSLSARGATGGVEHLKALATSPSAPCVPMTDRAQANTFVPPLTPPPPASCQPVDPTGSTTFNLYQAWLNPPQFSEFRAARMAVARGEQIFNQRALIPGPGGTCSGCHTTTNIGNNPIVSPNNADPGFFIRLGLDSPDALKLLAALDPRMTNLANRVADLPVYTLTHDCPPGPFNTLPDPRTGQPIAGSTLRSTDPGRALVTGQCGDFGAFKPPILRGLQARAPYFHNGAAETLDDVVNFYDAIFGAHLSAQEHSDLVAFLKAL